MKTRWNRIYQEALAVGYCCAATDDAHDVWSETLDGCETVKTVDSAVEIQWTSLYHAVKHHTRPLWTEGLQPRQCFMQINIFLFAFYLLTHISSNQLQGRKNSTVFNLFTFPWNCSHLSSKGPVYTPELFKESLNEISSIVRKCTVFNTVAISQNSLTLILRRTGVATWSILVTCRRTKLDQTWNIWKEKHLGIIKIWLFHSDILCLPLDVDVHYETTERISLAVLYLSLEYYVKYSNEIK